MSHAFTLYVTGLGMFVPDTKRQVMHVLFPRHDHPPRERHFMTIAFRKRATRFIDPLLKAREFTWRGEEWYEVDADDTTNAIGTPGKDTPDYGFGTAKLRKLTDYSSKKAVKNRFLGGQRPTELTGALRLHKGKIVASLEYNEIRYDLPEDGSSNLMSTGVCWRVEEHADPTLILRASGNLPVQVDISSGSELIIFANSVERDCPVNWELPRPIRTSQYPAGSRVEHFHAFHNLLHEHKPNPRLAYVGINPGDVIAHKDIPCAAGSGATGDSKSAGVGTAGAQPMAKLGIHPITCVLVGGDPGDPDDPDDPPVPAHSRDAGHGNNHTASARLPQPHERHERVSS